MKLSGGGVIVACRCLELGHLMLRDTLLTLSLHCVHSQGQAMMPSSLRGAFTSDITLRFPGGTHLAAGPAESTSRGPLTTCSTSCC